MPRSSFPVASLPADATTTAPSFRMQRTARRNVLPQQLVLAEAGDLIHHGHDVHVPVRGDDPARQDMADARAFLTGMAESAAERFGGRPAALFRVFGA